MGAMSSTAPCAAVSSLRRSSNTSNHPPSSPNATPTATVCTSSAAACPAPTDPASAASVATRRAVRPVPSLSRLSPSRMLTSRGGRLARRAEAATTTASVGARMAPSANAIATGMPAISTEVSPPMARVEIATSPTARARTGRRTDFRST